MAMTERSIGLAGGVRFAADLERFGDAVALVDTDGRPCSYAELARRADDVTERLGSERRLVLLQAENRVDAIAAYLGALRGGHAVLLVGADAATSSGIADAYEPDVVVGADGALLERHLGSAHELHPDLRLLLSTSGSTGSPKLVRLSASNLDANARSIAGYLGLGPADRAITALPMQYCYGLSVLNSHLSVGASVVCTETSVVDPCFWDAVERHGVTNVAGVPHTFDLLDRAGVDLGHHPSLRFLTQAGGRMAPETVRRWARLGREHDVDLYVMYGQTEATARMAYLPPHLAEHEPDAVGVPVPGGSFRLAPFEGAAPAEGELVYAGPNVMLGYASEPADLALGATIDELATGDVARIGDDGLVRIVGRRRDFLKVFGLRIDLREVRRALEDAGIGAEVAGDDTGLAVAVLDGTDIAGARALLAARTSLPDPAVRVAALDAIPRLVNGKVDTRALLDAVRDADSRATAIDAGAGPVAALYEELLGARPGPDDTFVGLGGDSLTYVEASIALEQRLGALPAGWHLRPVRELEAEVGSVRRPLVARMETGVVLRALAIVLIVGSHTGAFLIGGGAHVLFAAAGFNMARFQLSSGTWSRSIARVAVPSMLWIGGVAAVRDDFDLAHALLLHGWVGGPGRWAYWFVEVLVQVLVVLALAFRVPAVRRFERRHPFGLPALLLVPTLTVRFDVVELGAHHRPFFRPHEIAWIFVLGWLAAQARSPLQRLVVSGVAIAAIPGFFGNDLREWVLLGGLLALLWIPWVPVPRGVPALIAPIAASSLYVYLSHVQIHPLVSDRSPVLGLVLSLAAGFALWRGSQPLQRAIERGSLRRERTPGTVTGGATRSG